MINWTFLSLNENQQKIVKMLKCSGRRETKLLNAESTPPAPTLSVREKYKRIQSFCLSLLHLCQSSSVFASLRQSSSVFVSLRQSSSVFVSLRQSSSVFASLRQSSSVFFSLRQSSSVFLKLLELVSSSFIAGSFSCPCDTGFHNFVNMTGCEDINE